MGEPNINSQQKKLRLFTQELKLEELKLAPRIQITSVMTVGRGIMLSTFKILHTHVHTDAHTYR